MEKGAIMSDDGKHRYQLWRIWDTTKPCVFWLMHNPSTADGKNDDPTIRRIIQFSKDFGFGGLYVGNLSSYRATEPSELNKIPADELIKFENIQHTVEMMGRCVMNILAHGIPTRALSNQDAKQTFPFSVFHYLKLTKSGQPSHPLYLKSDLKPIKFL